jgi:hypothetical protein
MALDQIYASHPNAWTFADYFHCMFRRLLEHVS